MKMVPQKARSPPAVVTRLMSRELNIILPRTEQKLKDNKDLDETITVIEPSCENKVDDSPTLDQRLNVKGPVKRGKGFDHGFRPSVSSGTGTIKIYNEDVRKTNQLILKKNDSLHGVGKPRNLCTTRESVIGMGEDRKPLDQV